MLLLQFFFFRTHTKWNHIPLAIREIESIKEFKNKLSTYMWDKILPGEFDYDPDYSLDTDLWSGLPQINNLHIRAWLSLLSVLFISPHITSWMGTVFTLLYDLIASYSICMIFISIVHITKISRGPYLYRRCILLSTSVFWWPSGHLITYILFLKIIFYQCRRKEQIFQFHCVNLYVIDWFERFQ